MFQGNEDTQHGLRTAAAVIEEFRRYDPRMEATAILAFILVAAKPGVSMGDLGARLAIGRAAMTRNIQKLSVVPDHIQNTGHQTGLDLVSALENPDDAREKLVIPTRRGNNLAERLSQIIVGAQHRHGTP